MTMSDSIIKKELSFSYTVTQGDIAETDYFAVEINVLAVGLAAATAGVPVFAEESFIPAF